MIFSQCEIYLYFLFYQTNCFDKPYIMFVHKILYFYQNNSWPNTTRW